MTSLKLLHVTSIGLLIGVGVGCSDVVPVEAEVSADLTGPTGVTVQATGPAQLDVTWVPMTTGTTYMVHQSKDGAAFAFMTPVPLPDPIYHATSLTPGSQYCFVVQALFTDNSVSTPTPPVCGMAPTPVIHVDLPAAQWRADLTSTGGPILSSDGVWQFDPSLPNRIILGLALPEGAMIRAIRFDLRRNNALHPAVGQFVATLYQRVLASHSTTTALSTSIGPAYGTAWTEVDLIPSGASVAVGDGTSWWLSLATNDFFGAGDPAPLFDSVELSYSM